MDWSRVASKWGSKTGGFHRSISLQSSLVMVVLVRLPELVCLLKKNLAIGTATVGRAKRVLRIVGKCLIGVSL